MKSYFSPNTIRIICGLNFRLLISSFSFLLLGNVQAQNTYYSKAAATNFNAPASWGTNTDGTGFQPASVTNADNYIIQNGAQLTLTADAGVRTLLIQGAGRLTVSANTLTVQRPENATWRNASLGVGSGTGSAGALEVSGGNLNINGFLELTTESSFTQTGGEITVDGNAAGITTNSVPSGTPIVTIFSTNLNLTGGRLTIVDPHASSTSALQVGADYTVPFGTHTFRFGNGVSTDLGTTSGNGFRYSAFSFPNRFTMGNLVIDMATTGSNRHVTLSALSGINGNLTINSGEFRLNSPVAVSGNITNNGTLTSSAFLYFSSYINGTLSAVTNPQTVSGSGVFRNNQTTSTANYGTLVINNTSSTGISFASTQSLLSGTNTGTAQTVNFMSGVIRVTASGNPPFIMGTGTGAQGNLVYGDGASGGFRAGTRVRRWFTSAGMPTAFIATITNKSLTTNRCTLTTAAAHGFSVGQLVTISGVDDVFNGTYSILATTTTAPHTIVYTKTNANIASQPSGGTAIIAVPTFPFISNEGAQRHVILSRSATAFSAGGWVEALHTDGSGFTNVSITDGAYTVNRRTNANWSFTSSGLTGTTTLFASLCGDGEIAVNTFGSAPRLVQGSGALGTHVAATGSAQIPNTNRSGLTLANLTTGPHYLGVNSTDLPFVSVNNGAWENGATWNTGVAPTATDNVLVSSGTTVTVNSAAASARLLTVGGTLNITGNTLSVQGNAAGNGLTIAGSGVVNASGGTLNVGVSGTNNRTLLVATGARLNVSASATLNVFGNINFAAGSVFAQTGGNIVVDGNAGGIAANSVPNGTPIVNISTINTSGVTDGTLTIVDPHAIAGNNPALRFNFNTFNGAPLTVSFGANHTLRLGNGSSTDPGGDATNQFLLQPNFSSLLILGNIQVSAGSGTNRWVKTTSGTLALNNLTIDANSTFSVVNADIAGNITNNGTFTATTNLNLCRYTLENQQLAAPTAQTIGGSGVFQNLDASPTANAPRMIVANSSAAGVTFNVPFSQIGNFEFRQGRINTTATNVLTHIETNASGTVFPNISAIPFPVNSAYVNGPFRVQYNTGISNAAIRFPVGNPSQGAWLSLADLTTNAAVTLEVSKNAGISAPNAFNPTLTGLLSGGGEWLTSIVSGSPANITSYRFQLSSTAIQPLSVTAPNSHLIAGYTTAAGNFSAFGSGSTVIELMPDEPNLLEQNSPASTGAVFPERLAIGITGAMEVTGATIEQSGVAAVLPEVPPGSSNNNLARVNITALGLGGTVALTNAAFNYTGSAPATDITAVTLWSGTINAPVTQIGSTVISAGSISFGSLNHAISAGDNYLWLRFNVGAGAAAENTVDVSLAAGAFSFNLTGGATAPASVPLALQTPAGNVLIGYCFPTYATGCGSGNQITNVTLAGNSVTLNNSSACASAPHYYNRVNSPNADLMVGSTYTVNVAMGSDANQFARVWIDFNGNGTFETSESFSTGTNAGANGTSVIAVTIPPAAQAGFTRMRIRGGDDAAITAAQACGATSSASGETEDYIVEIISGIPASVTSLTATQQTGGIVAGTTNNNLLRVELTTDGSLGALTLTQARFTYSGTSASDIAAAGISLWSGTASAPTTQIGSAVSLSAGLATFSGLSVNLETGVNYFWLRVNSSASAMIDNLVDASIAAGHFTISASGGAAAPGSQPTASIDPAGNRFIDYCAATYGTGCSAGNAITNVTLAGTSITLNNNSGCAASPYYTFFNALNKPDLYMGSTYPISITLGADATQYVRLWIDFNRDGNFDASESFAPASQPGANGIATFNITVPPSAVAGDRRMRIRGGDNDPMLNTMACGASDSPFGETQDYIVSILTPADCSTQLPFPATTATASATAVCSGETVDFGITVPMPPGVGITYQWLRNGSAFGAVQSVAPASFALTSGGAYAVRISCNGTPQVTSSAVNITVNNPLITGTTPAIRCGIGTINLSAVSSGGTVEWYAAATGGTLLATGNSFTTPQIGSTTTYYAQAIAVNSSGVAGAASPSIGSFGSTTSGTWQSFDALSTVRIPSFSIYPTNAGTLTVVLRNNAGTILFSQNVTVTAAQANSTPSFIGTPLVVPVNWTIEAGDNYRLEYFAGSVGLLRNTTGASGFYGTAANGIRFTGNSNAGNAFWNTFYNVNAQSVCISPRVTAVAIIIPAPGMTTNPFISTSICEGQSVTLVASSTNPTYTYTWVGAGGTGATYTVSPTTTTTYIVNGVTSGGCTNQRSVTVLVNPRPASPTSVVTTPAVAPGDQVPFCPNPNGSFTAISIGATATPLTGIIFFDDFTGGLGAAPWSAAYNQVQPGDVHGAAARWVAQSGSPQYVYSGTIFSPDAGFAVSVSDAQGLSTSGATATLTSPVINTRLGTTSAVTLTYDYSYRQGAADIAKVQYSTNGSTWFDIPSSAITSSFPAAAPFGAFTSASVTIPAAAYAGGSFRIRFLYESDGDWWWAIDNVQVSQTISSPSFTWAPTGGLYNDAAATTAYEANTPVATIYAAPYNDRTYQVTTSNQFTTCTSTPANISVDVCQIVIDQICNAQTISVLNTPPSDVSTLTNYSNIGAPITGSLAGLCQPLKNDVWFKATIPASGDLHVYTFSAGNNALDLDSVVVALYSSSDGTCTGVLNQLGCDAFNGADGHTYVSASGLVPGSIAFIRVGSRQANVTPEAGRFKLLVMSGLYWTGAANNQVFTDPLNWYGSGGDAAGVVPSASKSVIIPQSATGNYPYVSGSVSVHGVNFLNNLAPPAGNNYRITIDPLGKLQINSSLTRGGFIMCTARGTESAPNPTIEGTGIVEFMATNPNPANNQHFIQFNGNGTATTQIELAGATGVKTNASLTTNNRLTFPNNSVLLSGGVQTSVPSLNYGGNVVGNIRYIRSGSQAMNYDYWSSPVTNATTALLINPFQPNIYDYDNTRTGAGSNQMSGWNPSPISSPIPMQLGRGYIQTFAGSGSVTFNGPPTAIDFDHPVTVTGSNSFNLIGNPYPSSINTAAFRSRNSARLGSLYFWNQSGNPFSAANYVILNSFNILAGATPPGDFNGTEIGACQGFFASVASPGDILFRNDDRVPRYPSTNTQWFDTPSSISLLRMKISNASGLEHNTVVAFSEAASDSFIDGEDSRRLPGNAGLEIFSISGKNNLSIQMFDTLTAERIVELETITPASGKFTLNMSEFVNFDPTVRVYLEDRSLKIFQNLNQHPEYVFNAADKFNGVRFRLHFMAAIGITASATCIGDTNGKLVVKNRNADKPVDLTLKNVADETIASVQSVVGEHIFQQLSPGSYMLRIAYGGGDFEDKPVSVNSVGLTAPASFVASATEVELWNAIIEFNAGDDQSIEYAWDFGDGSPVLTGTSKPVYAYMQPGIYTVTLTTGGGGCKSTTSQVIRVKSNATGMKDQSATEATEGMVIYPNPASSLAGLMINMGTRPSEDVLVRLTDATGRVVFAKEVENVHTGTKIPIQIGDLANGLYQVMVEGKTYRRSATLSINR